MNGMNTRTNIVLISTFFIGLMLSMWLYEAQQKRELERFINSPKGKASIVKCLLLFEGNSTFKAKVDEFAGSECAGLNPEGQQIFKETLSKPVNFKISDTYHEFLNDPKYQDFEYKLALAKDIAKRNRKHWDK